MLVFCISPWLATIGGVGLVIAGIIAGVIFVGERQTADDQERELRLLMARLRGRSWRARLTRFLRGDQ